MTNEQETVELAPVWAHALATIVLKRVTTTIEDTFVPLTGREIDWPSQRRDTESLAKLIHLKAEAHYGNQHAADQATITTLRERLAAAEAQLQKFKLSSRLGRKFIYQLGGAFGLSQGIMQARTDALLQIDKLEAEGTEPQPKAETAEQS